jgi:tetratricopeptide (TPR) repeat protein
MKRKVLIVLLALVISNSLLFANAESNNELSKAIKLYKAGNYSECYTTLKDYIKEDSSNVLAYYYLAIASVQVGHPAEALYNYERVLNLSAKSSNVYRYAYKGKICLESPSKCDLALYNSPIESFILNKDNENFSQEVKSKFEQLKIENLMREINRSNDISPDRFKDYKDFSSSLFLDSDALPSMGIQNSHLDSRIIQAMLTNNMELGL